MKYCLLQRATRTPQTMSVYIYTLCRQVFACVLLFHLPCHVVLYKPLYQLSNYNNIAMAHTYSSCSLDAHYTTRSCVYILAASQLASY